MKISVQQIKLHLAQIDTCITHNYLQGYFQEEEIRNASVVIPMIKRAAGWNLLLIRRTKNEYDQHSGQVAFPGGKFEPPDNTLLETAKREFGEETGVDPHKLQFVGRLQDMITVTKFRIRPYVAILDNDFVPRREPAEVDRIFEIPLNWLADPANIIRKQTEILGTMLDVIVYEPYDQEILWGASARMVEDLLQCLRLL